MQYSTSQDKQKTKSESGWHAVAHYMTNAPLRSGSSLFSRTSRASVPSSIKSSLVITPIVLRPRKGVKMSMSEEESHVNLEMLLEVLRVLFL